MRILLALIVPPLAILLCGRIFLALFIGIIWVGGIMFSVVGAGIPFVIACSVVAVYVVVKRDADKRARRLEAAVSRSVRQ